jgi:hypothetical protein
MLQHPTAIKNRFSVQELASKLQIKSNNRRELPKDFNLFSQNKQNFLEEMSEYITDLMHQNYISPKEFGKLVKVAFDRTIRYYQRDRLQARELVNFRRTDTDFYQWVVGSGFTAAFNAPGAAKRTVMFDMSSRFARIYKAGLAVEYLDETRESMSIDLLNETISKVVDAFDELETSVILGGISAGVADGVRFRGVKHASHVIDFNSPAYSSNRPDHDKLIDMVFISANENYRADVMVMSLSGFYEHMRFDEWKDASKKWNYVNSTKVMTVIEGGSANRPVLPFMNSIRTLVVSNLIPDGEIIMYDKAEYVDFAERLPLTSKMEVHDGLHDLDTVTYRSRSGIAVKEAHAAVKGINARKIHLPDNKFA